MKMQSFALILAAAMLLSVPGTASAQTDTSAPSQANDVTALAKAAQNPVANMRTLPLQLNWNFNAGPLEKDQQILNIQPVIPVSINEDWNLITRTIIPVISQPAYNNSQSRKDGIGDVNLSLFFSPKKPSSNGWIWGVGPALVMDTATNDRLGQGAWSAGPSAVALTMPGNWVVGGLLSNVWSLSEDQGRPDVNQMLFQPFINYNFPKHPGRYLTFSPVITANWEADSGQKWVVPLGLGIGQVMKLGKQAVNIQLAAYYNAIRPDDSSNWQLRFQFVFMFPK